MWIISGSVEDVEALLVAQGTMDGAKGLDCAD